jgi:hypothetical protein
MAEKISIVKLDGSYFQIRDYKLPLLPLKQFIMNYTCRTFLFVVAFLVTKTGFAQLFSGQQIIAEGTNTNDVSSICTADLDGDGYSDVVASYTDNDKVVWYRNLGNGSFGAQQLLSNYVWNPESVHAADMDGDGDLDLLFASSGINKIALLKNQGAGYFVYQEINEEEIGYISLVTSADINGDGALDVLAFDPSEGKIIWFLNLGGGQFNSVPQGFYVWGGFIPNIVAADLDGDGDNDLLCPTVEDNKISWFKNLGNGNFGTQLTITTQALSAYSVEAVDLDGDGDRDVLSASIDDDKIAWYQNLGNSTFGPQQIVSTQADGAFDVKSADLNGDGDLDILSASYYDDKIAWYESLGGGLFGPQQIITSQLNGAKALRATDFDNDTDIDVVAFSALDNDIVWHKNQTAGCMNSNACNYSPAAIIDNGSCCFNNCEYLIGQGSDVDGDGVTTCGGDCDDNNSAIHPGATEICNGIDDDCDTLIDEGFDADGDGYTTLQGDCNDNNALMSPGNPEICNGFDDDCDNQIDEGFDVDGDGYTICEGDCNDNSASIFPNNYNIFGNEQTISSITGTPVAIYPADLDGDGDKDMLTCTRNTSRIAWFKNLGAGQWGLEQIISTAVNRPTSVFAADLDGDGDLDALSTSRDDDKVAWYQNLGNGNFGSQQILTTAADAAQSVYAADLDEDGDLDVLSASYNDDDVSWFRNLGGGQFSAEIILDNSLDGAWSVYASDLNADGDLEVLATALNEDWVIYHQNFGGGVFLGTSLVSGWPPTVDGPSSVYAADLNGDGYNDVLSASSFDDKIAWYSSADASVNQRVISTQADYANTVRSADLDGDGDMDVISASSNDDKIAWYENRGGNVNFSAQRIISTTADAVESIEVADVDGDGALDVVATNRTNNKFIWFRNIVAIGGCTDPNACNFDPAALANNGSCCYSNCSTPNEGLDADNDGYTIGAGDCNDNNASVHPGATEICNDIDDDCDNLIDEEVDGDCDGYTVCGGDCNDNNASIYPGATEICNGIDDDCDNLIDDGFDVDGDGYTSCAGDCNDNNSAVNPGATENVCNNIDDDCDGTVDEGRINGCTNPIACNYNAGANCDNGSCTFATTWYLDSDADNYYSSTQSACTSPGAGWSNSPGNGGGDCNDSNTAVRPGATEICGNGIDDDCDVSIDETCCTLVASAVANNTSCGNTNDGSIIATAINGLAPFTYSINGITFSSNNTFTNLTAGVYTVTIHDDNSCVSTTTVTIGPNTGPSAPAAINGPIGVCRNQTGVVFSVAPVAGATSYLWTLPTGATGSSTTNSISLAFSLTYNTGNLCVRAVNACGQSAQTCLSVPVFLTVPSTPGTISGGNVNACSNTSKVYSIAPVSTATSYLWTAPTNATITAGQGTTQVTVSFGSNFGSSGTIIVRAVNCKGNSGMRTLTVYNKPNIPSLISGTASPVCGGTTQTYSISATNGATNYTWAVPAGATLNSGQGTTSISVTFPTVFLSGVISVYASSACGNSPTRTLSVNAALGSPAYATGPTNNLCGGGTFTYTVPAIAGAISYNWTAPSGCTITANTGTSVTLSIPSNFMSGNLCYTVTHGCGTSSPRCTVLSAVPKMPAVISGSSTLCANSTGHVFSTLQEGTNTYTWTVPAGCSIASGQGTNSVTVNWGATNGTISVKGYNACGESTYPRTKNIYVTACLQGDNTGEDENQTTTTRSDEALKVEVYPNPNTGQFVIISEFDGDFVIHDEMGRTVSTFQLSADNYRQMEINDLAAGMYFVIGRKDALVVTRKVAVVR